MVPLFGNADIALGTPFDSTKIGCGTWKTIKLEERHISFQEKSLPYGRTCGSFWELVRFPWRLIYFVFATVAVQSHVVSCNAHLYLANALPGATSNEVVLAEYSRVQKVEQGRIPVHVRTNHGVARFSIL